MLPKTIKIGAHTYRIKLVPDILGGGTVGYHDPATSTIQIREDLPPSRLIESLIHESLHALVLGHEFKDEETIVTLLGEGLTALIKNNPELFVAAIRELSDPKIVRKLLDKPR